jgi:hypothetical protein
MAEKYFAGNSLAAFGRTSTSIVEVTTAGRFDSSVVSSAINVVSGFIVSAPFSATGTIYVRTDIYITGGASGDVAILLMNGAANAYRVAQQSGLSWRCQYWDGSAWVDVGGSLSITPYIGSRITMMLKVVMGTSMELFLGGVSMISGSGMSGAASAVTQSRHQANVFSQVMIADYDIRDSKYATSALNGVSASNIDGSGAVSAINETVLDDSTAAFVATTGHKRGFTHAGITVPSGFIIGAAVVSVRGRATGSIPDGKLGIRSDGTNYSGPAAGYNAGYEARQRILQNDPATATEFTQSGFNAAEIFLEGA